jgi:hypothetical protein
LQPPFAAAEPVRRRHHHQHAMGANQSAGGGGQQQTGQRPASSDSNIRRGQQQQHSSTGGILVVNKPTAGGRQKDPEIDLPARVPPILSLEGGSNQIDPKRHRPNIDQLDAKFWVDIVANIGEFASSRAELVAKRQGQLQEKIAQIDEHVQKFTDSYVNEQHRALASLNDDRRKMDEIEKMLQKCTTQSELCVSMLNKLNFLLPDGHKLEPLEP